MDSVSEHTIHKILDFEDTESKDLQKVRKILLEPEEGIFVVVVESLTILSL